MINSLFPSKAEADIKDISSWQKPLEIEMKVEGKKLDELKLQEIPTVECLGVVISGAGYSFFELV